MSDDRECGICGRDGGAVPDCELCKGNSRFDQPKAFTLSEERRGVETDPGRYTRTGAVGPKIAHVPGSADPTNSMGN